MENQPQSIHTVGSSSYYLYSWDCSPEIIYRVARFHARKRGLCLEDAEDCAISLVERLVLSAKVQAAFPFGPPKAWLHRCASNHASNFSRAVRRRSALEGPWDVRNLETARFVSPSRSSQLDKDWDSLDMREHILSAAAVLEPIPKAMLLKHYIHGHSVRELAEEYHRSQGAIEHVLLRARRRIKSVLVRRGVIPSENTPN